MRAVKLILPQSLTNFLLTAAIALLSAGLACAQTATSITGLYYSGMNTSGGLLTQSSNTGNSNSGTRDPHWSVTYASTNGGSTASTTYEGAAYVLNSNAVTGSAYVQNTTTAQWITAPGAQDPNNTHYSNPANSGGDFLPGRGTGSSEGVYIYTLAFTITGSGAQGTVVTNAISISLTIAADDQFAVYINPSGNGTTIPTPGTNTPIGYSAWGNTTPATLTNTGGSANAQFVIGTNYLVVVVDNTDSVTGNQTQGNNASGLLVYQVGTAMTIDGNPIQGVIPEVGTWLPVAGALGLLGWRRRRRRESNPVLPAGA